MLCSLEQDGGETVLVGKFCHQTLTSKSGILWIFLALSRQLEKIRLNHDVSDLQD
jgi:hypothetical protein